MFGRAADPGWVCPVDGSDGDLRLARAQHDVAWAIYRLGERTLARAIAGRAGVSVKSWSDYSLGKTWMSREAFAAAAATVVERQFASSRVERC